MGDSTMDGAEETPPLFEPEDNPCADVVDSHQHCSTPTAAAVSKVLDDDNLLIEILLRLGFPTTLVCAALVCKRWLCHASDRRFLSRFRKLHPPRLLGYYVSELLVASERPDATFFVPMLPQPPELAAVLRRVESVHVGAGGVVWIMDHRNSSVLTGRHQGGVFSRAVHHILCPERSMDFLPPLPRVEGYPFKTILFKEEEEEGGGFSYGCLSLSEEFTMEARKTVARVYMLQDDVWCVHTSATTQVHHPRTQPKPVLVGAKIYMASSISDEIFVLDLTASSFSTIQLPQGVKYHHLYSTIFSRADDASSVYLIHAPLREFKLRIWLHNGDSWLLVDTIYLLEMCASLGILGTLEEERIESPAICHVGDNAQFVFLIMCGCTFYLDVTSKTLRKVFHSGFVIYPFTMIWPPTFPALKDDPARIAI